MNNRILITLLAGYFFVYIINNLSLTYDRSSVQFLYLGVLNIVSLGYLFTKFSFNQILSTILKSKSFIYYSAFILISTISITVADNKTESFLILSQYLTFFFSFLVITLISLKAKFNFIQLFMIFCIISIAIESFGVLYDLINNVFIEGKTFSRSNKFSGFTANVNITAFSIVIKLPILLYYIFTNTKLRINVLLLLILLMSVSSLFILLSRGAFLAFLIVTFLFLIIIFWAKTKNRFKSTIISLMIVIVGYFIISNIISNQNNSNLINDRVASIQINTEDQSINERLRFYGAAVESISKNPFLGIGLGNWKIESIKYDSKNIRGYRIPFHAHNDFLQVTSESGIFAFFLFTIILFNPFVRQIKKISTKTSKDEVVTMIILISLLVYILDSMLNFPIARPISHIFLLFLLSALNLIQTSYEK